MSKSQYLSETNSKAFHGNCEKSPNWPDYEQRHLLPIDTNEMLSSPLIQTEGNTNQFSGTTSKSNSRIETFPSGLISFKNKHKQKQHCHVHQHHHHHQQQYLAAKPQRRRCHQQQWWPFLASLIVAVMLVELSVPIAKADENVVIASSDGSRSYMDGNKFQVKSTTTPRPNETVSAVPSLPTNSVYGLPSMATNESTNDWLRNNTKYNNKRLKSKFNPDDSIFLRFAKRFADDNNLVSGIIKDCYHKPMFSCFQKNVYVYLNEVLDSQDVNVTQRLKFYKNENAYQHDDNDIDVVDNDDEIFAEQQQRNQQTAPTQASVAKDFIAEKDNEIPRDGRSFAAPAPETPIEEVTNALYGKSIKFAMTHDIELKLPEMMFDGATFRISPKSIEGNGVIAKLELVPKQNNEARLAGKFLMKKIQKIMKSKLLLSFLALVLIIKIIKIKLFWLLPLVIGVGAAKKLLLKFLLFLFPALSHLFKLCSYYQQTYHSTKYHHHHHHINHHHTVIPPWHSSENNGHGPWQSAETAHIPEVIYSHPPKGHVSAYLHGAPVHETYGPPSFEHFEGAWENSGPGLGSEYISDINRVAHIDDKTNYFKPHSNNDANELHTWGLGTTPLSAQKKRPQTANPHQQQQHQQPLRLSPTLQKPPIVNQTPQNYQKPQATSHNFNPFIPQNDKPSFYNNKFRNNLPSQSAPSPVYTPVRQPSLPPLEKQFKPQIEDALSAAAQIAAQYEPTRGQQQQANGQQTQLSPEVSAQLKEAIRIQAEQRLVQQQQQILDKQPFVQDGGQPLMPLNYDPFYSPILLKVDKIIEQLGIGDEACKERVVCSMYKDPERYSPHSNFVSAELSRDTNELQTITNTNPTVVRFFRLIQAARDGQDHKNCLALYPNCNINTE